MMFSAVFNSCTFCVNASEVAVVTGVYAAVRFVFAAFGIYMDDDFIVDVAMDENVKQKIADLMLENEIVENADKTFTFSEEAVQQLRTLFDEYLAATPEAVDVVWLPVITENHLKASWFSSTESYYKAMSIFSMENAPSLVGMYLEASGTWTTPSHMDKVCYVDDDGKYSSGITDHLVNTPVYFDLSDTVFHYGSTQFSESELNSIAYLTSSFGNDSVTNVSWYLRYIDKNGVSIGYDGWKWNVGNGWVTPTYKGFHAPMMAVLNPFYTGTYQSSSSSEYYVPVASSSSGIYYVPVFVNVNAYKDWITGQGSYYKFDSGYTGGDITINPNADYSAITDAIADVMKQSIANGDTMSTMLSHMQAAFSKTLAEISGTLDDIGDNTAETNSWLEKIFGLLETQQKEMQEYFKSAQESLDQIPDQISSSAQDITDAIQDTGQAIVDAISGITAGGGGSPPVIAPGDYPDGDQVDSSSGKSLWTLLGEGIAKIITAVLNLLKVLIFKGLDALGYLAGVMIDNIGDVFSGIGEYFDRYIGYIEENTFFAGISDILPEELKTIMVLTFFSVAIAGIIKYAKKG